MFVCSLGSNARLRMVELKAVGMKVLLYPEGSGVTSVVRLIWRLLV